MKKFLPLVIIGSAVGAAAYYLNANNKKHVERTIDALDAISQEAENTVLDLANEVVEEPTE